MHAPPPTFAARLRRLDEGRLALGALALLGVVAFAALMWAGRDTTFYYDEWNFVQFRQGGSLHTFLEPHNEHISIVPVAIYKALFSIAGLDHHWPWRIVLVGMHLGCAVVLFALVRRRTGAWLAVAAAALLLFLGTAWEDLLWTFQIGFLGSILGGLLAWLALDRRDTRGDVFAVAALVFAISCSSLGVPVAAGVIAELAWARHWRRLWVPAVPLALYAIWYLGYGNSAIVREGVYHAPGWAADAFAAAFGGIFGRGLDWGRPLALVGLALATWRATRIAITPRLVGLASAALAFWLLTGSARSAGPTPSGPDSPRYIYFGAVLLLLLAAELARGWQPSRRALAIVGAVVVASIAQGFAPLHDGQKFLRGTSERLSAELAAVELGAGLPDGTMPDPNIAPQLFAGSYLRAVHKVGSSPAMTESELGHATYAARTAADGVFAAADVHLLPAPARSGTAPGCRQIQPPAVFDSAPPPGDIVVRAGVAPVEVRVRRYAEAYGNAPIGTVPAGATSIVRIAPDKARAPWHLGLVSTAAFRAC